MKILEKTVYLAVYHARIIRRVLSIVLLLAAFILITVGNGVVSFASPGKIIAYWGTVFILLFVTFLIALIDLRAIRREFKVQKKALFVAAFSDEEFRTKLKERNPELFGENQ